MTSAPTVTTLVTDMASSRFSMAVHVLALLANTCEDRIKSTEIAESVNTNAVVIRRLLSDLHSAGLVVSQSGCSGGTCLTKSPSDISLSEVFDAVSTVEVFALHPNEPLETCRIGSVVIETLSDIKADVEDAVYGALRSRNLQDVINEIHQKSENKELVA